MLGQKAAVQGFAFRSKLSSLLSCLRHCMISLIFLRSLKPAMREVKLGNPETQDKLVSVLQDTLRDVRFVKLPHIFSSQFRDAFIVRIFVHFSRKVKLFSLFRLKFMVSRLGRSSESAVSMVLFAKLRTVSRYNLGKRRWLITFPSKYISAKFGTFSRLLIHSNLLSRTDM